MKFNHKILLMPLLTGLAFSVLFAITLRASSKSGETLDRIQGEFFNALVLSNDLEKDLLNTRQKLTGAMVAGDRALVAEADSVADRFRETLAGCVDVPGLADRVGPLAEEFEAFFQVARSLVVDLLPYDLRGVDLPDGIEERLALLNRHFDRLSGELAAVADEMDHELLAAIDRMGVRVGRARRVMNLTSLIFLGVLVLVSTTVIAAIVRPVQRMSRVTGAIASGDLGQTLEHQSNDVLGELADSIRDMQSALIRDITRREKAESELIAAQGQIIQSEKRAVLGELVAGLAHELNTPLGTLASSADVVDRSRKIIEGKCAAGADLETLSGDARFQRALRAMDRGVEGMGAASDRIKELVTGLKSFSQLDKAEYQQTDVNEGLRNTIKLMGRNLPGDVEIVQELGELEPLLGYPAQLNQLFLSLIMHMVRDIDPPGRVTVKTEQIADCIQIRVRDTGRGYEPDVLQALFKPSFKSDASRVKMDWDLITCQGIVDRHEGSMTAVSKPGEGTTYVIILPVWSSSLETSPERSPV